MVEKITTSGRRQLKRLEKRNAKRATPVSWCTHISSQEKSRPTINRTFHRHKHRNRKNKLLKPQALRNPQKSGWLPPDTSCSNLILFWVLSMFISDRTKLLANKPVRGKRWAALSLFYRLAYSAICQRWNSVSYHRDTLPPIERAAACKIDGRSSEPPHYRIWSPPPPGRSHSSISWGNNRLIFSCNFCSIIR